MANDLVVRLGASLDQYQTDMARAGDIADSTVSKVENSFSRLNPGINLNGLTTVIAGAAVGFTALLGLVQQLNKGLDDMAKQAERIGISTKRLQELQFAGSALGVGDIGGGLEEFSKNIQNSLSRVNDLKRVFDANNVSITDGNGKVRDMSKLLDSAFDIVRRAPNISDALQIGQFLGFSKEFSQELFRAGAGFQELASQANSVGAVIDQETIDKASTFTREWNKASAIWGTQMKASIAEFLPLLNDAIGVAQTLIGYVSTITSALGSVKDFVIAPQVDSASLSKLQQLNEQFEGIKQTLESGNKLNPIQLFQASNVQKDGEITLKTVDQHLALIQDRIFNFNKDPKTRINITGGETSKNPGLKQPVDSESRDQFETAIDQLTRRTAALKADTATVFQNTSAQAQLRAEFTLLNAIVRDGGEVTQAQVDKYTELRASMTQQQALQASGIQLTKDHAAAFETSSAAIARATTEHTKAAESLRQLNQLSSQLGSALASSFADAIIEGKNLNEVLNSLLKSIAKMAINSAFASIFNAGASGGTSPFLKLFGIGNNADGTDNWRGGPTWVGERGPEIVNLPKGSQVVDSARSRAMVGGSAVSNTFMVAGDVSPGTIDRLQAAVMAANRKADGLAQVFMKTQRMQATGVG